MSEIPPYAEYVPYFGPVRSHINDNYNLSNAFEDDIVEVAIERVSAALNEDVSYSSTFNNLVEREALVSYLTSRILVSALDDPVYTHRFIKAESNRIKNLDSEERVEFIENNPDLEGITELKFGSENHFDSSPLSEDLLEKSEDEVREILDSIYISITHAEHGEFPMYSDTLDKEFYVEELDEPVEYFDNLFIRTDLKPLTRVFQVPLSLASQYDENIPLETLSGEFVYYSEDELVHLLQKYAQYKIGETLPVPVENLDPDEHPYRRHASTLRQQITTDVPTIDYSEIHFDCLPYPYNGKRTFTMQELDIVSRILFDIGYNQDEIVSELETKTQLGMNYLRDFVNDRRTSTREVEIQWEDIPEWNTLEQCSLLTLITSDPSAYYRVKCIQNDYLQDETEEGDED